MAAPSYHGDVETYWCGMPHVQTPMHPHIHVSAAVRGADNVAAQAEQLTVAKYTHLDTSHHFVPFVVETSGVLGEAAVVFT